MSTHYQSNLAGKDVPLHDGVPQVGFYKMRRSKNAPWLPVAIWSKDGTLVCRVAGEMKDPNEVWTYCCGNPVNKADAKHAFETGSWPGDVPGIGDNSGDLSLAEDIEDTATQAKAWLKKTTIQSKVECDMAANWRTKLLDLKKRAEAEHKAEKAPHLEAGRAVDAKFKPIIETADDAANALRRVLTSYMAAEEAKLRAAAELERKAAEEAARQAKAAAAAKGQPEPEDVPLPLPEPAKVQAGGQRGRKVGLREITKYVMTDYEAALAHVKEHPDVRAAVEKVAAAMARAGAKVPGVEAKIEKVAA